jgi:TonB family protein
MNSSSIVKTMTLIVTCMSLFFCSKPQQPEAQPTAIPTKPPTEIPFAMDSSATLPPNLNTAASTPESDVILPKLIKRIEPVYPEEIKKIQTEQVMFIYRFTVDSKGDVENIKLIRSSHPGDPYDIFERAYRDAIAQWKYQPATKAGKPIDYEVVTTATVEVK